MTAWRRYTPALLTLSLILRAGQAWGEVARDPETIQRARALSNDGTTEYNLGRFQEALEDFSEAYELYPSAEFLFNIGQCHRELGNHERAIFFFDGYLRERPDAPNRDVVEAAMAESQAALERQRQEEELERQRQEAAEAAANDSATESAEPVETDDHSGEGEVSRRGHRRWWIWTLIGVVVAGAAAGTALGITLSNHDTVLPSGSLGTEDWR